MTQILNRIKVQVWTKYKGDVLILKVALVDQLIQGKGGELTLNIFSRRSRKIEKTRTIKKLKWAHNEQITIPIKDLTDGCAQIKGTFIDETGKKYIADILQDSTLAPLPEWLGSNKGVVTSKVPKPWTPLKVTSNTKNCIDVDCSGRTYRFGKSTFIDTVFSQDAKLLTKPVRLIIKSGKRTLTIKSQKFKVVKENSQKVVLIHHLAGPGFVVSVNTTIEFDGLIRFDWGISTDKPVPVDSMLFEISMLPSIAKYFYNFPGKWGSVENSGVIPSGRTALGFCPFAWLGDEEKGLSWFTESQQNCFYSTENEGTEILKSKNRVDLRIHIISKPVIILPEPPKKEKRFGPAELIAASKHDYLNKDNRKEVPSPLLYTFGMQATPIKKTETDAWDYRTINLNQSVFGIKPRLILSKRILDKLIKAKVKTVVIFEHWTDIEAHSKTKYTRQLQKVVKDCHAHGIKVLFYFGFLISDAAPEWDQFGPRSIVAPKRGYPIFHYAPQAEQSAWTVCLRGAWQDFVIDSIAKTMDKFDIDGVYLDGTAYPWGCTNTLHGCGHVKDDSSIGQTYPIFAVRNTMRRMYNVVKSRKPDGQINLHNSTCMTMPTIGWATSCWNGEQLRDIAQGADVHSSSWLESFRTEFMGHQWGMPTEFLCYGKPHTQKEAWGIALLHDIPVRPGNADEELNLSSKIWQIMDDFDRKTAKWHPYWSNSKMIKSSNKNCFTSLYLHKENGLMAVVSNLSSQNIDVELVFKKNQAFKNLDFSKAKNALTDRRLNINNNKLSVKLKQYNWILLKVPYITKSLKTKKR